MIATTPATIGTLVLSKQAVVIKAKAPKSAKHGATVNVKGKVSNDYSKTGGAPVTGKVTVLDGKKKVGKAKVTLNKKGKKKVVFKKVAGKGKYTLVAKYKGSDESKKSMTKVKFKIKK